MTGGDGEREALLASIRAALPEATRGGRLDLDRLAALLEPSQVARAEPFGLAWPGSRGAMEAADLPASGLLSPPLDLEVAGHAVIEGENLEVMRGLSARLVDAVKLIYIDPPYNTGKAFTYEDNWRLSARDYAALGGQGGEQGEPETQGRRHAPWLSMMAPRLRLARRLLRKDGSIFISIDEREVHHLRLLMDAIFGAEHFVACITWQRKKETASDGGGFAIKAEYILCYRRSSKARFANLPLSAQYVASAYRRADERHPEGPWRPVPITASKGHQGGGYTYAVVTPSGRVVERKWLCPESTYRRYEAQGRLYFGLEGDAIPQRVMYAAESRGVAPDNLWVDLATNKEGKKALVELLGESIYDTPKPVGLLRRILQIATRPEGGDLVLDFFAGSGTTGHAVMEANVEDGGDRRFILIQRPEPTGHARLATISDICRERVLRAAVALGVDTPIGLHRLEPAPDPPAGPPDSDARCPKGP